MLGVCVFAHWDGKIIALNCAKGRGIILPGGKPEDGELFHQTARREFEEETGIEVAIADLLFHGAYKYYDSINYCYAYRGYVREYKPVNSKEGEVVLTDWGELLKSQFRQFYSLLLRSFK